MTAIGIVDKMPSAPRSMTYRRIFSLLITAGLPGLLVSCESTSETGRGASYDQKARQAWAVRVTDGVSSAEASALAAAYMHRYVDERGSTGTPVDQGGKYMVPATGHIIYVEKTRGLVSMQYGPTVEPQDF